MEQERKTRLGEGHSERKRSELGVGREDSELDKRNGGQKKNGARGSNLPIDKRAHRGVEKCNNIFPNPRSLHENGGGGGK